MLGGCLEPVKLSLVECNLIDKVIQIPKNKWTFVNDMNSRFYLINEGYRFILYISGGVIFKLRMQSETVSTEYIELTPNEKLKNYGNSLFEDVLLAEKIAKDEFLMKLDENLTRVINFEPRSREE